MLEAIVATGIFILVAVALSGVWVMYGRALTKSGEHLAANHLARSLTEGLMANGYDWLLNHRTGPDNPDYLLERSVRGRDSSINYKLGYQVHLPGEDTVPEVLADGTARLTVLVKWNSPAGGNRTDSGPDTQDYHQSLSYVTYVFRRALEG